MKRSLPTAALLTLGIIASPALSKAEAVGKAAKPKQQQQQEAPHGSLALPVGVLAAGIALMTIISRRRGPARVSD